MNEPDSVAQFHAGGVAVSGMQAVYDLSAQSLDALVPGGGRLLDLGVGTGRALGRFLRMRPDVRATGVDLAPNMLAEARRLLDDEGVGGRASLLEGDLTSLPDEIRRERWDAISAVWTLHHLPDLDQLRAALGQIAHLRQGNGGAVWLFDFQRLRDPQSLRELLTAIQPDVPPVLLADALASEAAAFTHEELRAELTAAGLDDLDSGLAQPIPWLQAFWSPAPGSMTARPRRVEPPPLSGTASDEAARLRRDFSRLPGSGPSRAADRSG